MQWNDEGFVLSARPYGENSLIVEVLSRHHGRHAGLVRGGRGRRLRPVLQAGNSVQLRWQARLADHLGLFAIEAETCRAALIMTDGQRLSALQSLCALCALLPEREPVERFYRLSLCLLDDLAGGQEGWLAALARWELHLLAELGYGLDLSCCAATGGQSDLIYVSPRSGRAVSAQAGAPYREKLLDLPAFLLPEHDDDPLRRADRRALVAAFRLSGFFLEKWLLAPEGKALPAPRQHLLERLELKHNPVSGNRLSDKLCDKTK